MASYRQRLDYVWRVLAGDEFPPPSSWPMLWRSMFYDSHKSHADRYRLFVFLWQNGMVPMHALFWVMFPGDYDSAAWRHMIHAYKESLTVDGRLRLNRNRVYNLTTRKVE